EIVDDKSILYAERFLRFGASKKFVKGSIELWKELGINLQQIDILDESFPTEDGEFAITKEFIDSIVTAHPEKLPIHFVHPFRGNQFNAKTNFINMESPTGNVEDNSILYSNILLPNINSVLTSSIYAHEITHTQVNIKNQCGNLLNTETLPILVEEIFGYKLDRSLKSIERMRNLRLLWLVKNLYRMMEIKNMAFSSKIGYDTYIKSTIQAIKLSNIYINGSENIKKEIQRYINRIIAEEASLIEMLEHYEANFEECSHKLKDLKILYK
ncbi:MAG: hypothetical protein K2L98_03130, partial [Bacilli bacterium]|nr:hypothetical protein [Bacilli bacterium]